MYNRHPETNNRTKKSRKVLKPAVLLGLFVALTLVFSIYQASIRPIESSFLSALFDNATDYQSGLPTTDCAYAATISPKNSTIAQPNTWYVIVDGYERVTKVIGSTTGDKDSSVNAVTISCGTAFEYARANGAVNFYVKANIAKNEQNKEAWFSATCGGNTIKHSTNGTGWGEKNGVAKATTITANFHLDVDWQAAASKKARIENLQLLVKGNEITPPTFSFSNNTWQNSPNITISDSGAGLQYYSYKYTPLNGSQQSVVHVYTNENTKSRSIDLSKLKGQGKYTFTATDNLGNTSSECTIYYYNPTISVTKEGSGVVKVEDAASVTNLSPSNNYEHTLSATTDSGSYFAGWTGTGIVSSSPSGIGSYVSDPDTQSTATWTLKTNIPGAGQGQTSVPSSADGKWKAKFVLISSLFDKNILSGGVEFLGSNTLSCPFDNCQHGINEAELQKKIRAQENDTNHNYTVSVTYINAGSGTPVDEDYGTKNSTMPKYAGTYTVEVTIFYNKKPIGYGTYTLNIAKVALKLQPTFKYAGKTYDGTTSTEPLTFNGWKYEEDTNYASYELEFSGKPTMAFASKNVGDNIAINITDTSGIVIKHSEMRIAKSFEFGLGNGVKASITKAELTISADSSAFDGTVTGYIGASNYSNVIGKIYDGTTSAKIDKTKIAVNGVVNGETVNVNSASVTSYFSNKNVGKGKTVTVDGITLSAGPGTSLGNYCVSGKTTADGTYSLTISDIHIVRKEVSVVVTLKYNERVYDGTNTADIDSIAIEGLITGDESKVVLKSGYTATFEDKKVGTDKTVTVTGLVLTHAEGLDGAETNYRLPSSSLTLTASIYAKSVTIGISCEGKTYDGTDTAVVSYEPDGVVNGDIITVSGTAKYNSADAGKRTVTATNFTLSGTDAGNYVVITDTAIIGNITISPKNLVSNAYIGDISEFTYDGKDHRPEPIVTDNALGKLKLGTDFDYGYPSDVKNAGEKPLTVTGKGNYTGKLEKTYVVNKANCKLVGPEDITIIYGQKVDGSNIVATVYNASTYVEGAQDNLVVSGTWKFVSAVPQNPSVSNSGEKTVAFTPASTTNYNTPNEVTIRLTVNKRPIILTVNEQSSVYGDPITFNASSYVREPRNDAENRGLLQDSDTFGALKTSVTKESDVGEYAIDASSLANENYVVTYTSANYVITKRSITIRPKKSIKTYGEDDPTFGSDYYTVEGGIGYAQVTGALSRTEGENVGSYVFTQGAITNANNTNYSIKFINDVIFEIKKRSVTVTPNDGSSYFGESINIDPTLFKAEGVIDRDLSGASNEAEIQERLCELFKIKVERRELNGLTATNKVTVGEYDLVASLITVPENYEVTFGKGKYTIYKRPIIVTPKSDGEKSYGDNDPVFDYDVTLDTGKIPGEKDALVAGYDNLSGALTREAGEDVGSYLISQGTLLSNDTTNNNYDISFSQIDVFFKITQKAIKVIPNEIPTINFGDDNPLDGSFGFSTDPKGTLPNGTLIEIVGGLRLPNDVYEGEATPSAVGNYSLLADFIMLNGNPNYAITIDNSVKFTISALTALITAENVTFEFGSKKAVNDGNGGVLFGDTIENATASIAFTAIDKIHGNPIELDEFTGCLGLTKNLPTDGILGADTYTFAQGSLNSLNYVIELASDCGTLTVTKRPISIKIVGVDENNVLRYPYGNTSVPIEYAVCESTPIISGHELTIASRPSRELATESNVGNYKINIGNLETENSDYTFTLDNDYYFEIIKREIVIVPFATSSVYGGNEVNIKYTTVAKDDATVTGLLGKDTLNGKLARVAGKNAGAYAITLGTITNDNNLNYSIFISDETVYYTVTPRDITISAKPVTQTFGEPEQSLTIRYLQSAQLVQGDSLVGSLDRDAGTEVGTYAINQGTVTTENNPNYNVMFKTAQYTIKPRPVTIIVDGASKTYGTENDPEFPYKVLLGQGTSNTPFVAGYDPTPYITISRVAGETVGQYAYKSSLSTEEEATAVLSQYKLSIDVKTNKFVIVKANTVLALPDTAVLTEDGTYTLDSVYLARMQMVNVAIVEGDSNSKLTFRVNGRISAGYTAVGNYTVVITAEPTSPNYNGTSVTIRVTVKPYSIDPFDVTQEINANALRKTYGDADDTASFRVSVTTALGETVKISVSRANGEDAGSYDFTDIELNNSNYSISLSDTAIGAYTIEPKHVEVLPPAFAKTYGNDDPALRQSIHGVNGDVFDVEYSREVGEDVATYGIREVVSLDSNYTVSLNADGVFTINRRSAQIDIADVTVTFIGSAHTEELSYQALNFIAVDEPKLSNLVLYVDGYTTGNVPILAGTYNIVAEIPTELNDNYDIAVANGIYTIAKAPLTVTPQPLTIEYGNPIPEFTYSITDGTVYDGYPVEGSLGTVDSSSVGIHYIPQGTLDENGGRNANYQITFIANVELTITARALTITPSLTTTKVYGDTDKAIAYEITYGELADGDTLLGALSAESYEHGTHAVTIGTLSELNPNYTITLADVGATLYVAKRPVNVVVDRVSSVYGEDLKPLTYTVTDGAGGQGLVNGDKLDGELTAIIGSHAGEYDVLLGTLNGKNYDITFVPAKYVVEKRPITISINDQASDFGKPINVDQTAYVVKSGSVLEGDVLNIAIAKASGTDMGKYALTATFANDDYDVTFENGVYTIHKYRATITVDNKDVVKVFDGTPYSITAVCDGGANVIYSIDGKQVDNAFTEIGIYVVELTAGESADYYAPESVTVTITIRRDVIVTGDAGIDVTLENESGFNPDATVNVKKISQNDENMNSVLSSNQKIIGAFSIGAVGENISKLDGTTYVKIKVPTSLLGKETIKVVLSDENNKCTLGTYTVESGYITLEATGITGFAFVEEATVGAGLLYYIVGGIGLLAIVAIIIFMFKKRV